MIGRSVSCVAPAIKEAEQIVERLKFSGFSKNSISALFLGGHPDLGDHRGGALEWLGRIGVFSIPGAEPLCAAGPIVTAIHGVGCKTAKSLRDALAVLGIHEPEAGRCEESIKKGGIWFSVIAANLEEMERALWIFKDAGAAHTSTTRESRILESQPGESALLNSDVKRQRRKRFGRLFSS